MTKVRITVNNKTQLIANWEENLNAKSLLAKMPFTITMSNFYGREMCHRFGAGSLPVKKSTNQSYRIGDISYWPPMGGLVILYGQNSEVFEQVQIGHIEENVQFFKDLSHAEILFEEMKEER